MTVRCGCTPLSLHAPWRCSSSLTTAPVSSRPARKCASRCDAKSTGSRLGVLARQHADHVVARTAVLGQRQRRCRPPWWPRPGRPSASCSLEPVAVLPGHVDHRHVVVVVLAVVAAQRVWLRCTRAGVQTPWVMTTPRAPRRVASPPTMLTHQSSNSPSTRTSLPVTSPAASNSSRGALTHVDEGCGDGTVAPGHARERRGGQDGGVADHLRSRRGSPTRRPGLPRGARPEDADVAPNWSAYVVEDACSADVPAIRKPSGDVARDSSGSLDLRPRSVPRPAGPQPGREVGRRGCAGGQQQQPRGTAEQQKGQSRAFQRYPLTSLAPRTPTGYAARPAVSGLPGTTPRAGLNLSVGHTNGQASYGRSERWPVVSFDNADSPRRELA